MAKASGVMQYNNMEPCFNNLKFLIIMLVAFWGCSIVSGLPFKKTHVYLKNEIGSGVLLNYHCQSKDDDLGNRTLAYEQAWGWGFHTAFLANTRFWCSMDWWDDKNKVQIRGSLDIYNEKRDISYCASYGTVCRRVATDVGVFGGINLQYIWPR
ncbi:hypothetical protein IFM89_031655 [Coptis chinensis]|uniref:S-protein homolog n=1 Tax=Coptis chinensis TaxID=261450 RepID=A0A835J360_9MAGN|nr:hypothetical protein IFM89_031655 [Coptis chinensis]